MSEGPVTAESLVTMLETAATAVGQHRLLSTADLHADMHDALMDGVSELQSAYTVPEAEQLREELQGFWKLLLTS